MPPNLLLKKFITIDSSLLNILFSFFAIYKITKQPIQATSNTINEKIFSCTQNVFYDKF